MCSRFFVKGKLDYPNKDTGRASKKYVAAMRHLNVRFAMCCSLGVD